MPKRNSQTNYITVTELAQALNIVLERACPTVYVEGEIFQLTRAGSGHIYFTLKDDQSQIQCAMWRSMAQGLTFDPEVGTTVLCQGRPNFYNKSGRLQMIINKMQLAGEGDLQKRFLKLKEKLEKEGLFAPERKRALPFFPRAVGVVTSGTGAVIHDIMVKIRERMPHMKVYLVDVRVQGEGAAQEIADGIMQLNDSGLVDVIISGRGGGSLEDLWPFNEEVVARAVFASRTPIVSAVGHESDVTLADLAADERAPTPTAAAEMVVPHKVELEKSVSELARRLHDTERWFAPLAQALDDFELRLENRMQGVTEEARLRLRSAESALAVLQPAAIVETLNERLLAIEARLNSGAANEVRRLRQEVDRTAQRLSAAYPVERLSRLRDGVEKRASALIVGIERLVTERGYAFKRLESKLESMSPLRVLERGYSIVQKKNSVISAADTLGEGDALKITFAKGAADVQVNSISVKEKHG